MPSLRRWVWTIPIALALTASVAGAYVHQAEENAGAVEGLASRVIPLRPQVQQSLSRGGAWQAFARSNGGWNATWNEATRSPHRAYGRAIPLAGFRANADGADHAVRGFIAAHPELFGDAPALELAASFQSGNVWYVRYRQLDAGVPVMNADWEFRVGSNGCLMAFGADRYTPPTSLVTTPRVPLAVAREAARGGLEFHPATDRVTDGGLWVLPIVNEGGVDYRLVYQQRVITYDPRGSWVALVDAASGQVVQRRSALREAIGGTVTGTVHVNLPSETAVVRPLRDLAVNIGTNTVWTDSTGNYSGTTAGTVTVTAALLGKYCNVDRCVSDICPNSDASFAKSASDPTTVNIAWASTNSQQSERDAYYHVTKAHAFVKSLDPSYSGNDYPMTTYTDWSDNCNAYWDLATNSLNFLSAGGSPACPNTATMPDIVYHEYGHSVTDNVFITHGQPQGMGNDALAEGLSDVFAAYMTDDPLIGNGFFGVGTSLRTIATTRQWPQDRNAIQPHETGIILASAMWDLRQSLGIPIAATLEHRALYGLPDDPDDGVAFNEYFLDVLVADDNNNNLADGTPHYNQILAAFNAHGIGTNYNLQVAVSADDQANAGPFPVTAIVTYNGVVDALDQTSPTLHYSINNTAWASAPMFPTGNPDEYGTQVPAQSSAVVRYYVTASTINGGVTSAPPGAPSRWYSFIGGPFSVMYANDFENDLGWVVGGSGDAATTGIWTRAVPVGTAIQPGSPHTGQLCYVTGNGTPGGSPAEADVDGGKTTLTSATFDATAGGMVRPAISYWRWYSNNGGDNPSQDPWLVQISNNGGSTWANIENTLETDQSWRRVLFMIKDYVTPTNNMKIRFVATDDTSFPSLVEAAVDDFQLFGFPFNVGVDDGAPAAATLALAPASPNPFRGTTQLGYSLPARGRVDLSVFDVQGRVVRTLVSSEQEAGRHTTSWDGRDAAGRVVANGPYFVRLSHGGERSSEAVVLMR